MGNKKIKNNTVMIRKAISFALFDSTHDWQNLFYVRGLVLNVMMIKQLTPDYEVVVYVERSLYVKYGWLLAYLVTTYEVLLLVEPEDTRCRMMLWRMKAIFAGEYDYVFCRDADALVTAADIKCMEEFITSGKIVHNIWDSNAHVDCKLMGGMSGYNCKYIAFRYQSWSGMLEQYRLPIDKHGSDQDFLREVVWYNFKDSVLQKSFPVRDLGSDLCVPFIGSPGFNEMETLRYLRDRGVDIMMTGLAMDYPNVLYWRP